MRPQIRLATPAEVAQGSGRAAVRQTVGSVVGPRQAEYRDQINERAGPSRPGMRDRSRDHLSEFVLGSSMNMGPSGFEPESSGPEPPRIDQATPRTQRDAR